MFSFITPIHPFQEPVGRQVHMACRPKVSYTIVGAGRHSRTKSSKTRRRTCSES